MPFTDKIVDEINTALMTEIFSKPNFQGSKLFNIGYPQARTSASGTVDYVIQGVGEEDITFDDSAPVCLYHRQLQTPITQNQSQSFGDDSGNFTETAFSSAGNMSCIVWARREQIKMHESTLASWISSAMSINFNVSAFADFQVSKVTVTPALINFDSAQVFQGEYKTGQPPPFSITDIEYFSIAYKIETTYNKGCFTTCKEC